MDYNKQIIINNNNIINYLEALYTHIENIQISIDTIEKNIINFNKIRLLKLKIKEIRIFAKKIANQAADIK